jgi:hypothetical protein
MRIPSRFARVIATTLFAAPIFVVPLARAEPPIQQITAVPAADSSKADAVSEAKRRARTRLRLDDGSQESVVSVNDETQARGLQAVVLNRFTPDEDSLPLTIDAVSILFPKTCAVGDTGLRRGMEFEVVVYLDPDATEDPANATLAVRQGFEIRPSDTKFQTIRLDTPVVVERGDVWVGYTNSVTSTDDRVIFHAALDRSSSRGRSWLFYNSSSSFTGTVLDAAQYRQRIDEQGIPGNWLIRARGTTGASGAR